jgi:protein-tyrosine phosphatase
MTEDSFRVLAVCHANMCRSPMIERLLRFAVAERTGLSCSSAGTHARPGTPMHPDAATVLRERGADPSGFRARLVTPADITGADLILTADRAQRALCVALAPTASGRTFTMRQFGRLAAAVDPAALPRAGLAARASALVVEAGLARGDQQPVPAADDDLPDPIGRPVDAFRECAARIHEYLIDVMVDRLGPR